MVITYVGLKASVLRDSLTDDCNPPFKFTDRKNASVHVFE